MTHIDWSVLSGPKVSRRTMMKLAGVSGAVAYANWLAACGSDDDGGDDADPTNTTAAAPGGSTEPSEGAATETGDATPTEGDSPEATAPAGGEGEAKTGGTLTMGFHIQQVLTLDPPQVNLGAVAGELLANLFSSLVMFDEQLNIVPDLAEDWEVSEDGLQYTFHLREGLTFHNGDPLVAEDVIYTYERTLNPDFASPHANKLTLITDFVATDELTVDITLSEPFAPFLGAACSRGPGRALTPVSRRAVEEMGDEQFGLTPVGAGPFMIVPDSVEVGAGFEMDAFDGWYGGRPYLDKIIVRLIPEPSSRISALEAGDIDLILEVPATGYDQIADNDDFTIVESPGTNWVGLTMNFTRPPWDNPDARMAVAKAIDRQELIDTALFGHAIPATSAVAPAFGAYYRAPEDVEDAQAYDIDEAKRLAEAAGLDGLQPVILTASENPRVNETLRNIVSEIGIDLQLDLLQQAASNERWLAGDYDWNVNGSVVDVDPDDGHWNFFHNEGPWNTYGYVSDEVTELLEQTRTETDQAARQELWWQVADKTNADVAYVFLYHTPDRTAFYNYVKGYVAIPEQRYMEKVWLDQ